MQVKSWKLYNADFGGQWHQEVLDKWEYADFQADDLWRREWISLDCAAYSEASDLVYLGITSFAADIFKAFDRKKGQFIDLGFSEIADKYDAKFHRGLVEDDDGCIYGAIALLHCTDRYFDAPGGAIVKYDPKAGTMEKLLIPIPRAYIQSIDIDRKRKIIYGQCFPPEYAFRFDIETGECRTLALLGSGITGMAQGENVMVDDDGCAWYSWSLTRAWQDEPGIDANRLCKYDPVRDKVNYFSCGLPKHDGSPGYLKAKAFFNLHDGFIYASDDFGAFYRIDPSSGKAKYLFSPVQGRSSRLSALAQLDAENAYGIVGKDGNCQLLAINFRNDTFEIIGDVRDQENTAMWQCHQIVYAGNGVFYACENDNPYRSSYLWEVKI